MSVNLFHEVDKNVLTTHEVKFNNKSFGLSRRSSMTCELVIEAEGLITCESRFDILSINLICQLCAENT